MTAIDFYFEILYEILLLHFMRLIMIVALQFLDELECQNIFDK